MNPKKEIIPMVRECTYLNPGKCEPMFTDDGQGLMCSAEFMLHFPLGEYIVDAVDEKIGRSSGIYVVTTLENYKHMLNSRRGS